MADVNSNQAFRHILTCFAVGGLFSKHVNKDRTVLYNLYQVFVTGLFTILYPVSFWINLFTLQTLNSVLNNISVGLNLIISTMKAATVFVLRQNFFEIAEVVKELDRHLLDKSEKRKVRAVIEQCQKISLGYLGAYLLLLIMFAVSSLASMEHLIFPTWFPFDWKHSNFKFAIAFCYQFISACYQIVQLSAYDSYPTIYIKMLTAHVKALVSRIQKIGGVCEKTNQENLDDLVNCIKDHVLILKYLYFVEKVISQTIFLQFIVAAIVLCTTAARVVLFNEGLLDNISALFYLIVIILQVFPCCYYIEVFIDSSNYMTTAVYNCNWITQDARFKRLIIIFMLKTQKQNEILAGNIIPVSLVTFLNMVKFSYSMFAVLGQIKD